MDNKYSKISEEMLKILKKRTYKTDKILEFGSSDGHISYRLGLDGYIHLSLLDIRRDPLILAEKAFTQYGIFANFYNENFFDHKRKYDVVWNSGCIQCCTDIEKNAWIGHAKELSNKLILFWPDKSEKQRDHGKCEIKGFDQCTEQNTENVEIITAEHYKVIMWGVITRKTARMPYPFKWVMGVNEVTEE